MRLIIPVRGFSIAPPLLKQSFYGIGLSNSERHATNYSDYVKWINE